MDKGGMDIHDLYLIYINHDFIMETTTKKVRDLHTLFFYAKYTSNGTKTNKNRNLSIIYH